jgi:hypothetical protein
MGKSNKIIFGLVLGAVSPILFSLIAATIVFYPDNGFYMYFICIYCAEGKNVRRRAATYAWIELYSFSWVNNMWNYSW